MVDIKRSLAACLLTIDDRKAWKKNHSSNSLLIINRYLDSLHMYRLCTRIPVENEMLLVTHVNVTALNMNL